MMAPHAYASRGAGAGPAESRKAADTAAIDTTTTRRTHLYTSPGTSISSVEPVHSARPRGHHHRLVEREAPPGLASRGVRGFAEVLAERRADALVGGSLGIVGRRRHGA